jgi:hypothetical protein
MNRFAPKIARAIALASFSALSMLAVAPAKAVVIDFESLAISDANYHPQGIVYTENNFAIASSTIYSDALISWGTQSSSFPGSTGLLNNYGQSVNLSQVGGGVFTLSSIDLADEYDLGDAASITFTGTKADASIITQSFTTDTLRGLENFTFANFTDLVSVDWVGTSLNNVLQFDNINVASTVSATSVPEPFTVLGTIFGAGYGVALKRKFAKAQQDKEDIS